MSLYKLMFRKNCHLLVELEHRALWALKFLNFDYELAGNNKLMQLYELDELLLGVYKSSKLYKDKTKKWHDKHLQQQEFHEGEKVSYDLGGMVSTKVFLHGIVEVMRKNRTNFRVNGQRVKHYEEGLVEALSTT
ncbi:hypothetical protein CR513_48036, partial [Mucuna pruriens]